MYVGAANVQLVRVASGRAEVVTSSREWQGWRAVWQLDVSVLPPRFEASPLLYARDGEPGPVPAEHVPDRVKRALRKDIAPSIGRELHAAFQSAGHERMTAQLQVLHRVGRKRQREADDHDALLPHWTKGQLLYPAQDAVVRAAKETKAMLDKLTVEDCTPALIGRRVTITRSAIEEARAQLQRDGRRVSDAGVAEVLGVDRASVQRARKRIGIASSTRHR